MEMMTVIIDQQHDGDDDELEEVNEDGAEGL